MRAGSVCILGGSGFVGRHLIGRLTAQWPDVRIKVLTRQQANHRDLLVIPSVRITEADVHEAAALQRQFESVDAVTNLTGILNESRPGEFQRVHAELPQKVVDACRHAGVKRLLHMCALGAAADAPSTYQRTKAEGEHAALAANAPALAVTSLRPSVIFGPDDGFFCRFARLLALSPLAFPLPTPGSRFAPVYVGDVAAAFLHCLDSHDTAGQRLELCGPRTYTLKELVEYTARVSGHRRRILGLPDTLSRLQARVLERVPGKPYSYDNYLSSRQDSICSDNALPALGIQPTSVETVVPGYLGHDSARRYDRLRKSARR